MAAQHGVGFFLTLIILGHFVVHTLSQIVWDKNNVIAHQGDDITFTCTVDDLDGLGVIRVQKNGGEETDIMTDNMDLKHKFKETGRYHVDYKYKRRKRQGVLTVTYKGIRGEDGGVLTCAKLGDEQTNAKLKLTVLVPLNDLYMMVHNSDGSEHKIGDGSKLRLEENEELGVLCVAVVNGSLTPPDVKVYLNGADATNLFQNKPLKRVQNALSGFAYHYSERILSYITAKPNATFHNKNLTCVARAEGFPQESTSLLMDVEYAPILRCPTYEHYGVIGESLSITCEVAANPGSTIQWLYKINGDNMITVEYPSDDDNMVLSSRVLTGDLSETTLLIKQVRRQHITQFFLQASNRIGEKQVPIEVIEGAATTPRPQPAAGDNKDKGPTYDAGTHVEPRESQQEHTDPRGSAVSMTSLGLTGLVTLLATIALFFHL